MSDCTNNIKMIKENEQRGKSNQHRIDKLEKDQSILHEMNKNLALIAQRTEDQDEQIKEVKTDVKELKDKPSKRWDIVITTIIASVIGAAITALVTLL